MSTLTDSRSRATGASAPDAPVIELRGIRKGFGSGARRVEAVRGVDLVLRRGEIVALLGPNGAGKTTTLDILLGLIDADEGSARVFGRRPAEATAQGRIAAVLQTGGLLSDLTVGETVRLIASLYGKAALGRVPEVLARTDLEGIVRRRISKCSGGEQQRVRFALALVANPDILILDEPTAGMDVTARRNFWAVMRADADAGRTILFATHYLEEAEQFAPRTVVLNHGHVVADAATTQLRGSLGARHLSVTLPAEAADRLVADLRHREDIAELTLDAERLTVRATDTDALAAELLAAGAYDLEITAPTLEAAFTALTEG